MGCPLLVTLAVAAIRGKARRTVRDNLMVSELVGIWRDVNDNFLRNASLAGSQGAAALTYRLKVQQVYAASIQLAQASCVERGLSEETLKLLMQVLRMLPAGRWIPAAAIKAIMDALASDFAVRTTASCATDDLLELLEDFSVIMQKKQSVYNPDGVRPTSITAARRSRPTQLYCRYSASDGRFHATCAWPLFEPSSTHCHALMQTHSWCGSTHC
jgi:hypothetical protein